jgi:diacylglycerol O-acyltransferase
VLGRELTAIYPVGFLARRHGLALAVLSYNGGVGFGLLADPDVVVDLDGLLAALQSSFAELRAAAARIS